MSPDLDMEPGHGVIFGGTVQPLRRLVGSTVTVSNGRHSTCQIECKSTDADDRRDNRRRQGQRSHQEM